MVDARVPRKLVFARLQFQAFEVILPGIGILFDLLISGEIRRRPGRGYQ